MRSASLKSSKNNRISIFGLLKSLVLLNWIMTSLSFLSSLQVENECDIEGTDFILDPESLEYMTDFYGKRQELAIVLFSLYNSEVFDNKIPSTLNLIWNKRLKSTAGYFSGRKHIISLSAEVIQTPAILVNTLMHEMCHAAVRFIDNKQGVPPHGFEWRKWTVKARNIFPEIPKITVTHSFLTPDTMDIVKSINNLALA